jgi:hypothetical protein
MTLWRWLCGLVGRGYWVCPMDWQGDLTECEWRAGSRPVRGVSVYYDSGSGLKPYREGT